MNIDPHNASNASGAPIRGAHPMPTPRAAGRRSNHLC